MSDTYITVAGVIFSAKQVKSAILEIEGREVRISEKKDKEKSIGFQAPSDKEEDDQEDTTGS